LAFTPTAGAMSSNGTNPPSGVAAADAEAPRNKAHFSPQAQQAIYLKGQLALMHMDKGTQKEATCFLSLWYAGDGTIQAVQLAKSSGFPSLD
jgi:hypothetical protein